MWSFFKYCHLFPPAAAAAPKDMLEALEQRRAKYVEASNQAKASGDDRKARMHDRIAKVQYKKKLPIMFVFTFTQPSSNYLSVSDVVFVDGTVTDLRYINEYIKIVNIYMNKYICNMLIKSISTDIKIQVMDKSATLTYVITL